ncbi:hypothetical protein CDIK_3334 [Cucumispora dikerogammari]|nr:hypothetical protein CDIK_3334 [Cucumispora dikerogammari]
MPQKKLINAINNNTIKLSKLFTKSQSNKEKPIFDGHEYNQKEIRVNIYIWRCNRRGCKALFSTDKDYIFEQKKIVYTNHSRDIIKLKNNIRTVRKMSITSES